MNHPLRDWLNNHSNPSPAPANPASPTPIRDALAAVLSQVEPVLVSLFGSIATPGVPFDWNAVLATLKQVNWQAVLSTLLPLVLHAFGV